MNKVITINLNGNAYQVDEDGYNALRDYLDRAQAQLKDGVDKQEVIADLEQSIAEKCTAYLRPHKNVVTGAEIAQILKEIGPVQGDELGSTKTESSSPAPNSLIEQRRGPKRLYRLREGEILYGVCNGLAAYSDIGVTAVRVIFVLSAICTGGGMLLVYFLLAFVMPVAYTDEERASAYAAPPDARMLREDRARQTGDVSGRATEKRILPALLLCGFLGIFGAHRFYVGKIATGVLQLVTMGGLGIWAFIDFVCIAVGAFTDQAGNKITRWT